MSNRSFLEKENILNNLFDFFIYIKYINYKLKIKEVSKINKKVLIFILIIGIIVLLINIFFYQLCIVHGDSMLPTLKDGNIVLMKKYDLKLKYNDIVVINKDKKTVIKRIVGLPNDKIRIDDYLIVNDEQFDDKIINNKGKITEELILNSDEYFVLGDNRDNSIDSRFDEIGIIKEKEIKGKVLFK